MMEQNGEQSKEQTITSTTDHDIVKTNASKMSTVPPETKGEIACGSFQSPHETPLSCEEHISAPKKEINGDSNKRSHGKHEKVLNTDIPIISKDTKCVDHPGEGNSENFYDEKKSMVSQANTKQAAAKMANPDEELITSAVKNSTTGREDPKPSTNPGDIKTAVTKITEAENKVRVSIKVQSKETSVKETSLPDTLESDNQKLKKEVNIAADPTHSVKNDSITAENNENRESDSPCVSTLPHNGSKITDVSNKTIDLLSAAEKKESDSKHLSLPNKKDFCTEDVSSCSGRRQTDSNIHFTSKNARRGSKNVEVSDIRRVISSVRQSTRSGFGGTADFECKKPSMTPSERLKSQLESGCIPHPMVILPDDGKFWCDPPSSHPSDRQYYLSCFDMDKPWKEIYGDKVDIVVNPNEIAADVYLNKFSQVR